MILGPLVGNFLLRPSRWDSPYGGSAPTAVERKGPDAVADSQLYSLEKAVDALAITYGGAPVLECAGRV